MERNSNRHRRGELNANVFYGLTVEMPGRSGSGEWRVFGLGCDYRDGVVKTYNRLLAVRAADTGHINIGTYGGHYLQTVHLSLGTPNLLALGCDADGLLGQTRARLRRLRGRPRFCGRYVLGSAKVMIPDPVMATRTTKSTRLSFRSCPHRESTPVVLSSTW